MNSQSLTVSTYETIQGITRSCLALTIARVAAGVNSATWSRANRTVESRDCPSSAWWERCVAPGLGRVAGQTHRLGTQSVDRERSCRTTAAEIHATSKLINQQLWNNDASEYSLVTEGVQHFPIIPFRVPTLLLTKIQDFPGPPWKIFQDLFGGRECINMKKKTTFTYNIQSVVQNSARSRMWALSANWMLYYCCLFTIWTTRKMHDLQVYISRTFQFPGP